MARRSAIGMNAGRYAGMVFIALMLAYGYVLPRWADWNQNSRYDLTRALVEHHTVVIDRYAPETRAITRRSGPHRLGQGPGTVAARRPTL